MSGKVATERTPLRSESSTLSASASKRKAALTWQESFWSFIKTNEFVLKAACAIGLAKVYPPIGAIYLLPEITATWLAVIFIFLMAGLSLPTKEFASAAGRHDFNAYVLTFNFIVVSLLVFGITKGIRYYDILPQGLTDGMMVCACMPVTVTMVIVLTKSAKGDEAASVFIATVGGLLSVVVTPALLLLYIGVQSSVSYPEVFCNLFLRVVLPVIVGQVLQLCSTTVMNFVNGHKQHFRGLQETALIFILYCTFCQTFSQAIDASVTDVLGMALFQGTALIITKILAWYSLKLLYRNQPKLRVAGLYGCTQKSVSVGIPMISALYQHDPNAGLYTLPLLIWHPLQILIGSALAPHLAAGVDRLELYLAEDPHPPGRRRPSFFQADDEEEEEEAPRDGASVPFNTPSTISWPETGAKENA